MCTALPSKNGEKLTLAKGLANANHTVPALKNTVTDVDDDPTARRGSLDNKLCDLFTVQPYAIVDPVRSDTCANVLTPTHNESFSSNATSPTFI